MGLKKRYDAMSNVILQFGMNNFLLLALLSTFVKTHNTIL